MALSDIDLLEEIAFFAYPRSCQVRVTNIPGTANLLKSVTQRPESWRKSVLWSDDIVTPSNRAQQARGQEDSSHSQ